MKLDPAETGLDYGNVVSRMPAPSPVNPPIVAVEDEIVPLAIERDSLPTRKEARAVKISA